MSNNSASLSSGSYQYLGECLVQHGFISQTQLDLALQEQARLSMKYRLGDILTLRGWISRDILEAYIQNVVEPKRKRQKQAVCFNTHHN